MGSYVPYVNSSDKSSRKNSDTTPVYGMLQLRSVPYRTVVRKMILVMCDVESADDCTVHIVRLAYVFITLDIKTGSNIVILKWFWYGITI